MTEIIYFDRKTRREEKEKIYGKFFLEILYGKGILFRVLSLLLLPLFAKVPFLSKLYGYFQKSRWSRWKIPLFIRAYEVDSSEFKDSVESFTSFNAFFIRHLKLESRPITLSREIAILPADGRYLVFPHIEEATGFWVKGKKFSLSTLLQDKDLAARYECGSMVIARLCPVDYHRFHFPCSCIPSPAHPINGPLFSVNPIALKRNIEILSENKRVITELTTEDFGKILYIEIGATYVGTIHQTYTPHMHYDKGAEKGYFSFGGSCLILLFEPNRILFEQDLIDHSLKKIEVRGFLGQPLGRIFR